MRTGGRLLIDSLLLGGVDFMTCVPGESFLHILDAIYAVEHERPADPAPGSAGSLRLITTRHEAAAANMVEAAGKLTGKVSACFVTRGPGAMHASIAVHTAYQDGTPMLLVIGQVGTDVRGREAFQEMDYRAVFGTTAKSVVEIQDADRIGEHVARALYLATAGRPGPVVLVVPEDVLAATTEAAPVAAPVASSPAPSDTDVELLRSALASASRPLLVVGGPKWSPAVGARIQAFAQANSLPVAAAFRWQDAVDNRGDSYVGYLGLGGGPALREAAADADLIVALGPRLDDPTSNGFALLDPAEGRDAAARRIVLVGDDAQEAVRTFIPDHAVTASLDAVSAVLEGLALPASAEREQWTAGLRREHLRFSEPFETDDAVNLAHIVRHVREALPDDAVVTNGAGNYATWLQRFFEFRRYGTQLAPRNGAMGYGLPAGLAAAARREGAPVVVFDGDGCILMSGSELATAVQERLNIVLIIVNNQMFGTIRMHQENEFPGRVIATSLQNPDFALYAQSFGALGEVVETTAAFPAAFAAALAHEGPAVIELRTNPARITPDRVI